MDQAQKTSREICENRHGNSKWLTSYANHRTTGLIDKVHTVRNLKWATQKGKPKPSKRISKHQHLDKEIQ